MKQKPKTCLNCPLYGDGMGFVDDVLVEGSPVLVITMFPSQYEAARGEPRVGLTIEEYSSNYEKYAGSTPMSYANVIRCRGQRGVKLPKGSRLREGVSFCRQYDRIPESTELIVYQGLDVAQKLNGLEYVEDWRGFLLQKEEENLWVSETKSVGTVNSG